VRLPILKLKNTYFSGQRKWIVTNKHLFLTIIFTSSIASIYYAAILDLLIISIPLFFVSFFYALSPFRILKTIFPSINVSQNLRFLRFTIRDIPFLKIFIISFSWTYLTILIPAIINDIPFDYYLISNIFIRFLFVLAITIPFDIRDLNFDKVITLPSSLGIENSKMISYISLLFCEFIILILWLYNYLFISFFISLLITFEITALFIFFTKKDNKELFFGFYIEGLSILMFVLIYIGKLFI
jgi:hypothetical protein